ncbi:MAG: FAD-binding oxidoreductase [Candidatus Riflebacteria bacterium]|nr:FAD-binding oxidoreductase [Candidatus Riflebacteria bacterium]
MDIPMNQAMSDFESYLSDESRVKGNAEKFFFPENDADISQILQFAEKNDIPVTVSGGRTGVAAGAVPRGGWLLSMEKMSQVTGFYFDSLSNEYRITVQSGLALSSLRGMLQTGRFCMVKNPVRYDFESVEKYRKSINNWIFPPDPTEPSAQIGGMTATNASGAKTFRYGPMRNYIRAIKVVLPNGEIVYLRRGEKFSGKSNIFQYMPLLNYSIPSTKHACGYYSSNEHDLIDIFIGSEGTLGVISEIELALKHVEGERVETVAFFKDHASVAAFVTGLRLKAAVNDDFIVESIEYMCSKSLNLIEADSKGWGRGGMAVFAGLRISQNIASTLESVQQMIIDSNGDPDLALIAVSPPDLARFSSLRHLLPEKVNDKISQRRKQYPKLTKLGTDMAVPDSKLEEIMNMYTEKLIESKLEHVIFGHIGDNHLHVNILPANTEEYSKGRELYEFFAEYVVKCNGSVSAEHGIGKLKTYLLEKQFSPESIVQMKNLKKYFDPKWLLGRGNLFPE